MGKTTADELRDRLHPTPPRVILKPSEAKQNMDQVVEQMEAMEKQLEDYDKTLSQMGDENKRLSAENRQLKKFKPILESGATRLPVYIRTKTTLEMLKGLTIHHRNDEGLDSDVKTIRQAAQRDLDHIVDVVMTHMVMNKMHEVKALLERSYNVKRPPL